MDVRSFVPFLIFGCGSVLLFRLRGFFFLHPVRSAKKLARAFRQGGRMSRRTLILALAGTLGVGNITGVAAGLSVGGAGALFWLLFSSVFSAAIKYAETVIARDVSRSSPAKTAGMPAVIRCTFPHTGATLGKLYALLSLGLAFSMGAALQARAAAESVTLPAALPPALFSLILTVFAALVLLFGEGVARVTEVLIPLATLLYSLMCLAVIFSHGSRLPEVLCSVVSSAFTFRAGAGGIFAFLFTRALREGVCRGLLSNEAGAGTSAYAHAQNTAVTPCEEGMLGIAEVVADTVVLCPLTAFTVLLAVEDPTKIPEPFALLNAAFSPTLGPVYRFLMPFCLFCFAFSTLLCWFTYGREALFFLRGNRRTFLYLPFYLAAVFFGALADIRWLIFLTDLLLAALTLLSLSAVQKNSGRIVLLSEREGLIRPNPQKAERTRQNASRG